MAHLAKMLQAAMVVLATTAVLSPEPAIAAPPSDGVVAGRWTLQFKTISNAGFRNPRVGSSRTRVWIFEQRCHDGACRLVARRETNGGFATVRVVRRGATFVATWRTRGRCRRGEATFPYRERISFVVTESRAVGGARFATRLRGRLVGSSPKGGCMPRAARAEDVITGERNDVPHAPQVEFATSPLRAVARSPVQFVDASQADATIVAWAWDFGDPQAGPANASTDRQPTHTYVVPGSYLVTLTVIDDQGLTASVSQAITVESP
jgi:hypothetical protein